MSSPRLERTDLVISMTLAETFLLLLFVVWYGVVPNSRETAVDTTPPAVRIGQLQRENDRLKAENQRFQAQLAELNARLEWWRNRFDRDVPGSEGELKSFLEDLARGKPACQPDNNMLAEVSIISGRVSLRILSAAPPLTVTMGKWGTANMKPGTVLIDPEDIKRFLAGVHNYRRTIRGELRECRFDYILSYESYQDYHDGREQFEKYFSSGRRVRIDGGKLPRATDP